MRSSSTLCSPDGRLLYSTLSLSSTDSTVSSNNVLIMSIYVHPGIDCFQAIVYLGFS